MSTTNRRVTILQLINLEHHTVVHIKTKKITEVTGKCRLHCVILSHVATGQKQKQLNNLIQIMQNKNTTVIKPQTHLLEINLKELWNYRDLKKAGKAGRL